MKKLTSVIIALSLALSAFGLASCGSSADKNQVSVKETTSTTLVDEYGVGFNTDEDGSLTVSGYESNDTDVSIPDEFDGKPVKKIGRSAFKGQNIKTVTMPDGLEEIGDFSFALCSKLELVNIPDGVTKIGKNAFFANFALTELELPESLQLIEINAFNASGLKEITIPENVLNVGEYAFADCVDLEQVQFMGDSTVVAANAFKGCEKVGIIAPKGSPAIDVAKENKLDYVEI